MNKSIEIVTLMVQPKTSYSNYTVKNRSKQPPAYNCMHMTAIQFRCMY
jgi:hypothetical protein